MAEPSSSDLVGHVVSGRYAVEAVVGRGGQGVVYRALDQRLNIPVALKVLNQQASRDPQAAGRFLREQEALQALEGTAAIRVYDAGETADRNLFLALELLDGRDLEDELRELEAASRRVPIERMAELMVPVTATLDAAHAQGILHRDLKPANIFLQRDGGVRLLDFGFARLRSSQPLTAVGTIMGSPSYIAPEMWRARPDLVDHRVDVYAVGVILFRLVAGDVPFRGEDTIELIANACTAPRPKLSALRPDLPQALDPWVERALAVDPESRLQAAGQCLTELFVALGAERALVRARQAAKQRAGAAQGSTGLARVLRDTASTLRRWAGLGSKSPAPADSARRPAPPPEPPRPPLAPPDDGPDSEPPPAQRGSTLSRRKG